MKKYFLMAMVAVSLIACNSLSIVTDTVAPNGERTVLTSDMGLYGNFSMALGARIQGNDTVMGVLITSSEQAKESVFNRDCHLLVRLADDTTIDLQNQYDNEFEKETTRTETNQLVNRTGYAYSYDPLLDDIVVTPYMVSGFVPRTTTRTDFRSYALFLISKKQLHAMLNQPTVKLRVETKTSADDMKSPQDVQSKVVKLYNTLHATMAKPKARPEF